VRRAIAIIVLFTACTHAAPSSPNGRATVVRNVDGDTIVVHIDGRDESVRVLGIDTPETHKPDTPVECFGPEAAARMAQLLPVGTVVRLVRDIEPRDRYGRLLAYVYRDSDGLFVDLEMVKEGLAGTLAIAPNFAHRTELAAAEADARSGQVGLWPACGGNHVPGSG